MKCPKCQYVRKPSDAHVLEGICPACGIAYAKWKKAQDDTELGETATNGQSKPFTVQIRKPIWEKIWSAANHTPDTIDPGVFWGRVLVLVIFAIWGWSFILDGINWETIGGSFLHSVNLPFHEFGHVLFSPFGRFFTILGGSLFQIILPLIFLINFIWKLKDTFAASIMLWWCGQNFIDVSPYIADAPYRSLPLIMGLGEASHDWGNLLQMTGTMDSAQTFANISFALGTILINIAILWGVTLLIKQKRQMDTFD